MNIANLATTAPFPVADEHQLIELRLAGKLAARRLAHRQILTPARRNKLEGWQGGRGRGSSTIDSGLWPAGG